MTVLCPVQWQHWSHLIPLPWGKRDGRQSRDEPGREGETPTDAAVTPSPGCDPRPRAAVRMPAPSRKGAPSRAAATKQASGQPPRGSVGGSSTTCAAAPRTVRHPIQSCVNMESGGSAADPRFGDSARSPGPCAAAGGAACTAALQVGAATARMVAAVRPPPPPCPKRRSVANAGGGAGNAVAAAVAAAV